MKPLHLLIGVTLRLAVLAVPAVVTAQAPAPKPLVVTAQNLTAAQERGGRARELAQPGDVIRYSLVFTNVTEGAVRNVQFVDPIPPGLAYVAGSAAADQAVRIEYSIDRGASYAVRPVVVETVDGRRIEKPAPPAMYTHVRWTVVGSVAPGAQVIAEFKAQLAAPAAQEQAPGEAN